MNAGTLPVIVANTQIRRDDAGRYCLNDVHQASGGATRHKPGNWLRLQQTRELISEIYGEACASSLLTCEQPLLRSEKLNPAAPPPLLTSEEPLLISEQPLLTFEQPLLTSEQRSDSSPVLTIEGGLAQGTYVAKELVYAYAMWISPAYHLRVIRAYDAAITGQLPQRDWLGEQQQFLSLVEAIGKAKGPDVQAGLYSLLLQLCQRLNIPAPELSSLAPRRHPRLAFPAFAEAFWRAIDACTAAGAQLDHSHNAAVLAFNLPQVRRVAEAYGHVLPAGRALTDALHADPRFVEVTAVHSRISGKAVKSWLFRPAAREGGEP